MDLTKEEKKKKRGNCNGGGSTPTEKMGDWDLLEEEESLTTKREKRKQRPHGGHLFQGGEDILRGWSYAKEEEKREARLELFWVH